jgi:S1-C subfamily serine protease
LRARKPGDTMRLTVVRDGKRVNLSIALGERPVE